MKECPADSVYGKGVSGSQRLGRAPGRREHIDELMEDQPPRLFVIGIVCIAALLVLFLVNLGYFKYQEKLSVTLVLDSRDARGLTAIGQLSVADATKVHPGQPVLLKNQGTHAQAVKDLHATVESVVLGGLGANSRVRIKITGCPECFALGSKFDGKIIVRDVRIFQRFF